MNDYPAKSTVHWPGREPIFMCLRHTTQAERIADAMGFYVPVTHAVPEGAQCQNCINEAQKTSGASKDT
jgi:hypothetical protein